jgi:hypothetical protein
MMDAWTSQHLDQYVLHHVPHTLRAHFRKYAERRWQEEPVYWNSKGWGVMLEKFLTLSPKDWDL